MSDSVREAEGPRGNRPAGEKLRDFLLTANHLTPDARKITTAWLDAALRAERLAGRQEAVADILERTSAFGRGGWVGKDWLLRALDEVGVAGLTENEGAKR